jgi:hypothetical protein
MNYAQGRIVIDLGDYDEQRIIESQQKTIDSQKDVENWIREEYKNLPNTYRTFGRFKFFMRRVYDSYEKSDWQRIFPEGLN